MAGGLGVIRISGEDAIDIAEKIFKPFGDRKVRDMKGHTCAYGHVIYNNEIIDDAVLTVFRAPKSYTGENTAEISCHGGIYVTRRVLRCCIECGAQPAQAGEFTKRAFLSGKLSLTQAEGVMEIISANGENALRSANLVREGRLFRLIRSVCDTLVATLADLAAWNDYPDDDIPPVDIEKLSYTLSDVQQELKKLIDSYDRGRIFRNGLDTVIAGKPNVGKSTLMNMLLGYRRSIVTDIAGTTRDIVEESAQIGDFLLRLSDTAGIRATDDTIESLGVDLARDRLGSCDAVFAVFDASRPLDSDDNDIISRLRPDRSIIILNKTDLPQAVTAADFKNFEHIAEISAKQEQGIEQIERALDAIFAGNGFDPASAVFANERQKLCAEKAYSYLSQAADALRCGATLDAVTVLVDRAADCLLELTGEKATEAVIDEVFSRFCVGK